VKGPAYYRVLSIDGGGIRGVIPALVLAEIEHRTGKPICQLFDLIAGTSTGGILALGFTRPSPWQIRDKQPRVPFYAAKDLVELYMERGKHLFQKGWKARIPLLGNLFEEKYLSGAIYAQLDRYFETTWLREAVTEVLITGYEIRTCVPWFFSSRKAKVDSGHDFLMRDVARATSAAPTFFEPHTLLDVFGKRSHLVDGGIFANNPAMCAYVAALNQRPMLFPLPPIYLVSLGTGQATESISPKKAKTWGLAGWARHILTMSFDGVSDTVDYQLKTLVGANHYHRMQITLPSKQLAMDNVDASNLKALHRLTTEWLAQEKQQEALDIICSRVGAR